MRIVDLGVWCNRLAPYLCGPMQQGATRSFEPGEGRTRREDSSLAACLGRMTWRLPSISASCKELKLAGPDL